MSAVPIADPTQRKGEAELNFRAINLLCGQSVMRVNHQSMLKFRMAISSFKLTADTETMAATHLDLWR